MRHLIVPSQETEFWINKLRDYNWLAKGTSVQNHEGDNKLIPISEEAPLELNSTFSNIKIADLNPLTSSKHHHYTGKLQEFLDGDLIEKHADDWPTSYDRIGDLVLIKLKDEIKPHSKEIGLAILQQHTGVRLVLEDRGVVGEWRVRDLHPLAEKTSSGELITVIPNPETLTLVKEHGNSFWIDPTKVYYSPRLSTERLGTLKAAKDLHLHLGRPIIVADPYAGVGPSIIPLIVEKGLVGGLLASDLNPATTNLLEKNLVWRTKANIQITNLEQQSEWAIGCADARKLKHNWSKRFDLLLVNLPHSSLEHLEDLLPLMNPTSPTLIRGWTIIEQREVETKKKFLQTVSSGESDLCQIRSYSPNHDFYVFEIRNNW